MDSTIIRKVKPEDINDCYEVEYTCYTSDGASKEKIGKRIQLFPEGFLVAEIHGKIVGIINSGATNVENISDEEFKDMIGHDSNGKNIVIFSLAVLPEFRGNGISKMLMSQFIKNSKEMKKENILLLCKTGLISYYRKYHFLYRGTSKSLHGGFSWHEMYLPLL